jgi:TIM-barrel protein
MTDSRNSRPFDPPVVLASLSGQSDAAWAKAGADFAGGAMLGGIAIDEPTRAAAREMIDRDRTEFLPRDPVAFVDSQLEALDSVPIRPGWNVRTVSHEPLRAVAAVCADHDAVLEINAHCRQAEMCTAGGGELLLSEPDRLNSFVKTAAAAGPSVSVKVRAEVPGVDLPRLARRVESAGASMFHVDAMDSEAVIDAIDDATDMPIIANNGVRGWETVREYVEYGADAVSVGRPSDDPAVLSRVKEAASALLGDDRTANQSWNRVTAEPGTQQLSE